MVSGGAGRPSPAVAEQEPAVGEAAISADAADRRGVGAGEAVDAVADQVAPEQGDERPVDHFVHLLAGGAGNPCLTSPVNPVIETVERAVDEVIKRGSRRLCSRDSSTKTTKIDGCSAGMHTLKGTV
ncbi:hypothetical protein BST29_10910 [Mycobacterium malmoense]|uniref:Uncharacterized protein n=1 Tax=Mycobacterium malmoense TaxID=1780 RepID=A0ABX3SS87_MYCMA|nr:hypothetical protein BST29_10910 [Mycobacterium malmoense]